MECNQHQKPLIYNCSCCNTALCRECRPVSFHEKIYCPQCMEKEEKRFFAAEDKKHSVQSYSWSRLFSCFLLFLLFSGGTYYYFFVPRMISVSVDDKERLRYYLSLAYDSPRNSETYQRQMDSIMRLEDKYRNLIGFLKRGEKSADKKHYEEAIKDFEIIKKLLPDWDGIYILIAQCYKKMGKTVFAKDLLKQAQELNPEHSQAYILLGEIHLEEQEIDEAILQYTKAHFIDRSNPDVLLSLCELYVRKKSFIKAREFRDEARKLGANTQRIDDLLRN